jgi:hypothetical protein
MQNRIHKQVKDIGRSFSRILAEQLHRITGARHSEQGFIQADVSSKEGVFADPSSLSTRTLLSSKRFIG